MYYIVGTAKQMESFSASFDNMFPAQILEYVNIRIKLLDDCYGGNRDIDTDLGGYVVLFPNDGSNIQPEKKNCWKNIILMQRHSNTVSKSYRNMIACGSRNFIF